MRNPVLLAAGFIAVIFISLATPVAALEVNSDLANADLTTLDLIASENKDFWHPKETLKLTLPSVLLSKQSGEVVFELDAIDITALMHTDNSNAEYKPLQAMFVGQHQLRIVVYSEDGDIEELGFWGFEVRQSALFQDYNVAADSQIIANYRTSEKNIGSPTPDSLQGQASSQVAFNTVSGDWRSAGQFDLFYDSVVENRMNNRAIDNGEFLFSLGNRYTDARIGHQTTAVTSLVMDNFRRRGVTLEHRMASINSRVSGFSLSSKGISGFGQGLGISDSRERVDGVTFDSSPFADSPRSLYITGVWLKGGSSNEGQFTSSLNSPQSTETDSRAWSFSAESLMFEDKLRLKAEYAETDYDFDISDTLTSDRDSAHSLLVTYSDVSDSGVAWNAGASSQKIGTFFRSLANIGLPSDKELIKTFAGAQWSTFGVQANVERQQDNVENIKQLPKIQTDLSGLSFNWSPNIEQNNSWIGRPTLTLATQHQSQLQKYTPVNFLFPAANNDIQNWQFNSQFSYQINSWGLALTSTEFEDRSLVQNDSKTMSLDLFANLTFGEDSNISLSPMIAFNQTENKTLQIDSTSVTYALQSRYVILANELYATFDLNLNRNQTSDDFIDSDNLAANFSINWNVLESSANRFGVELSLSGAYNDYEDKLLVLSSHETYQAFFSVTVTLPSRTGQN